MTERAERTVDIRRIRKEVAECEDWTQKGSERMLKTNGACCFTKVCLKAGTRNMSNVRVSQLVSVGLFS